MLPVILAHSQTAVSQVTSDLSCHDGTSEDHVGVAMIGIEGVERGAVEEEKPTEEDGKLYSVTYITFLSLIIVFEGAPK